MDQAIQQINGAVALIGPEIVLLATVCIMFLAGPFFVDDHGQAAPGVRNRWGMIALFALGVAGLLWWNAGPADVVSGPFQSDALVWFVRGLSLVIGAALVLILWQQVDDGRSAECYACLLAILAGVNFVALANDLIVMFLSLELVSIPTYVLLYLPGRSDQTREATLKYFLLSIFSSTFVLYGFSLIYGVAGTTAFPGIAQTMANVSRPLPLIVPIAGVLIAAGLSFRITAVPFHFYAPDVFEGVASSGAAMLSFVPKIAGITALLRLLPLMAGTHGLGQWVPLESAQPLLAVLAILTMCLGNLMALRQKNIQRLMAYSSVAHAGYMLVGLSVGDNGGGVTGPGAVLFYLAAYGLMTLGVFAALAAAGTAVRPVQTEDELAGLGRRRPAAAILMAIFLFSLIGLPPTAGFLGKFNLFLAAWSEGTPLGQWLAILLALNAAVAAWYYLRLVTTMYLQPGQEGETVSGPTAAWVAGILCAGGTLLLFAAPQGLWLAARASNG